MHLLIKNFGPLNEGRIDLSKKFYLFVGHNNSGKTYVAQLLWGIFHPSTRLKFLESLKKDEGSYLKAEDDNRYTITDELICKLLRDYSHFILTETIPEIFNLGKDHFLTENCSLEFVSENDLENIKKKRIVSKSVTRVMTDGNGEPDRRAFEIFEVVKEKDSLMIEIRENELDKAFFDYVPKVAKNFKEEKEREKAILTVVLQGLFSEEKPFYLPASRLFYPIFYEYVFRYEKDRREEMSSQFLKLLSSEKGLDLETVYRYKSRYTQPMNALMNEIYNLNQKKTDMAGYYNGICEKLEEIIGGQIILRKREGLAPVEFYLRLDKHTEKNRDLEMYLCSSSVNQLTALYLFFKYWVGENSNFLIIDEPEENLHPKNQTGLLDLLVQFVNQNNRVLITTHSTLLAQAVNNHFCLGILKERGTDINRMIEKEGLEISPDTDLLCEDIGVYFFNGKNISSCEAGEYGVLFRDFMNEERKNQNIAEILTDKIYYQNS